MNVKILISISIVVVLSIAFLAFTTSESAPESISEPNYEIDFVYSDIDKIKNLGEKQRFINSTGEYENSGLIEKIKNFEQEVTSTYANTSNKGLDLISILAEKIENESIIKKVIYFLKR